MKTKTDTIETTPSFLEIEQQETGLQLMPETDLYKMYADQVNQLEASWKKSWSPPPRMSPWEWAEANIYLSDRVTPYPGDYDTSKTPYVREPMEAYTDRKLHYIVLMWAAQSSKTLVETLLMLYNMANDPGNQIFMFPNTTMGQSFSETRLQPMIEDNECLRLLKPADRHKFKNMEMHMKTGTLNIVGGNSPTNLASRNAGKLFTDEVDKLKAELGKEADPLSLLFERAKWFWDFKCFITSTVTTEEGHIYKWYLEGTQEEYHVPCQGPDCGEFFYPTWKDVEWDTHESVRDTIKTARIVCPHCGFHNKEVHKRKMLQKGKWIAQNLNAAEDIRSFHYTEILSPITQLPNLVNKFLKAKRRADVGDVGELKNFVNSSLCQPWKDELGKEKTEEEIQRMMVADEEGLIPDWCLGLFAGIDTQDNGFYFTLRAFGRDMTSRLVHYGFASDFYNLEQQLFNAEWYNRAGDAFRTEFAFIDAGGHRKDEVHDWTRTTGGLAMPAMARDHQRLTQMYSYSVVDKKAKGKTPKNALKQLIWSSAAVKDIMAWKMGILPGHAGAFEIPATVTKDYQKQLRSEYKDDKGYWRQIGKRPNHYWDCEALCFIAAITRGVSNRASYEDHLDFIARMNKYNEQSQDDENRRMW